MTETAEAEEQYIVRQEGEDLWLVTEGLGYRWTRQRWAALSVPQATATALMGTASMPCVIERLDGGGGEL